jgi:hypothetical protein
MFQKIGRLTEAYRPKKREAYITLKQPEIALNQGLFGEHLLRDRYKPIALVESEKTAIIASVYLPQFIWVAVGGMQNLNIDMIRVLKNYRV